MEKIKSGKKWIIYANNINSYIHFKLFAFFSCVCLFSMDKEQLRIQNIKVNLSMLETKEC